jgi:prepilin-type processing-associated H-X9-DG protein
MGQRPYEPDETEERPSSSYFSKKEVRVIFVALVLAALLASPVFIQLKRNRDKHVCKDNLLAIAKGIDLYANDNNDMLPPMYESAEEHPGPRMFRRGPITWISLISRYKESRRSSFECPTASESEVVLNEPLSGPDAIRSSYGMFGPRAAASRYAIASPSQSVLVSETSNRGASDTFDPVPFRDAEGNPLPDGFCIGFDNTNFTWADSNRATYAKSEYATRLAFPNTANGNFGQNARSRHDGGIHFLFVDLHIETRPPEFSQIRRLGGAGTEIVGAWNPR